MSRSPARDRSRRGERRPSAIGQVVAPVDTGIAALAPEPDQRSAATLWLDDTPQSYVDLADPTILAFEYVRHIGDVIDICIPSGPVDALHLGGGGLTLPRYVAVTRPGSRQRAVEIDAALVELVRSHLPLPPRSAIRVTTGDGRAVLERTRHGSLDLVVTDVFVGGRLPPELTSTEYFAAVAAALRPDGVAIMNLVDGMPLRFTASLVATSRAALRNAMIVVEPSIWRGRRFGNLLLLASHRPMPVSDLSRRLSGGAFPARVVAGDDLDRVCEGAPIRTDAQHGPTPEPPVEVFAALRRPRVSGLPDPARDHRGKNEP